MLQFILMCTNLFEELILQFEMSKLFETLKLHVFEHAVNFVLVELCLEELGDAFEGLCLELLASNDEFIMVVLMKQHVIPLEHERVRWLCHVAGWQGFGSAQHLLELMPVCARGGHQILSKRIIVSWLHVDILLVAWFFIPNYCADKKRDCAIEVFLVIAIFTLTSFFGIIFKRFREVLAEHLKPGGTISVAQDILEFQED
jgi:hypothetical protein